jgi:hypothetical protein
VGLRRMRYVTNQDRITMNTQLIYRAPSTVSETLQARRLAVMNECIQNFMAKGFGGRH